MTAARVSLLLTAVPVAACLTFGFGTPWLPTGIIGTCLWLTVYGLLLYVEDRDQFVLTQADLDSMEPVDEWADESELPHYAPVWDNGLGSVE